MKHSHFSFTKKYILALSLIALFSILAFYNFSNIIDAQEDDGEIINISGKQRTLSQKIALYSLSYKTKSLEESVSLMRKYHAQLLSLAMSKEIKSIYYEQPISLDKKVKEYIKEAENFAKTRAGRSLNFILKNSQPLLRNLDLAVSLYQKEAELRITNLYTFELFILILTLMTLIFEALFIFRPVEKKIKKHTRALFLEKEYSEMVTQTNTNAIIVVNERFLIQTFNKSAQEMFGYTQNEMINTTLLDDRIIPNKYLQAHIAGLKDFMDRGELKNKNIVFELEGKTKDKKLFPIRVSFGTRVESEKKVVVANIQNITSEKNKDALINEQSKLAAMGEMIGNIAHQWRQPLSAISTIATGVKLRHKNHMISDEELYKSFDKIKEYTRHLSSTIDDFKDFFVEDKKKKLFFVSDILKRSKSLVEATYKDNGITLFVEHHNSGMKLSGSESEFSQVILNILNNAKDVLIEKDIKEKLVLIKSFVQDDYIYINIYDNGGGIPEAIKLKIFEPYFTTKHKSQGTGIGLFMSSKIIKQHFDGELSVTNYDFEYEGKKYHGAKFTIKIKLA